MFVCKDVTKLIGDTARLSNSLFYIAVGVTVNPVVYTTVFNEVFMFNGESTIQTAAFKLWCAKLV